MIILLNNQNVLGKGDNSYGQISIPDKIQRQAIGISVGQFTTQIRTTDLSAVAIGLNDNGQCEININLHFRIKKIVGG